MVLLGVLEHLGQRRAVDLVVIAPRPALQIAELQLGRRFFATPIPHPDPLAPHEPGNLVASSVLEDVAAKRDTEPPDLHAVRVWIDDAIEARQALDFVLAESFRRMDFAA